MKSDLLRFLLTLSSLHPTHAASVQDFASNSRSFSSGGYEGVLLLYPQSRRTVQPLDIQVEG